MSDAALDDIADTILTSWRQMGRFLKLTELDLTEIELDYYGEKEKAFQMLHMWREKFPSDCLPEGLFSRINEPLRKRALRF